MTRLEIPVNELVVAIRDLLETVAAESATDLEKRVGRWHLVLETNRDPTSGTRIVLWEDPPKREAK